MIDSATLDLRPVTENLRVPLSASLTLNWTCSFSGSEAMPEDDTRIWNWVVGRVESCVRRMVGAS